MGLFTFFTSSWFGLGDGGGLVAKSCSTLVAAWTIACQDHLSMGFARQEYWSGLPFTSPGDLPDPGLEPGSPTLQAVFSLGLVKFSKNLSVSSWMSILLAYTLL